MKSLLGVLFFIVLALETESMREMMIQLSLILTITMIFLAYEKRERRIHRLKSDVFLPIEKK